MPRNPTAHASHGAVRSIGFGEFVALIAALMAAQAMAIDAMLPALPSITNSLHLTEENHSQWVITSYVIGLSADNSAGAPRFHCGGAGSISSACRTRVSTTLARLASACPVPTTEGCSSPAITLLTSGRYLF